MEALTKQTFTAKVIRYSTSKHKCHEVQIVCGNKFQPNITLYVLPEEMETVKSLMSRATNLEELLGFLRNQLNRARVES